MRNAPCLLFLAAFVLCSSVMGVGQVVRRGNCVVDAEVYLLPACAMELHHGNQYIVRTYLHLLFAGTGAKLIARFTDSGGWIYFDRTGRVHVRNVATFDNFADDFHAGLVRVVREEGWGLSDAMGRLVVPMEFDGILNPSEGDDRWRACKGCKTLSAGEYSWFKGGDWYWIDRFGHSVKDVLADPASRTPSAPSK